MASNFAVDEVVVIGVHNGEIEVGARVHRHPSFFRLRRNAEADFGASTDSNVVWMDSKAVS
jgi:hypothetical protein